MNACFGINKEKEKAFIENGRILQEKLIASCDGKCNPSRSFSAEELKTATNNYDEGNVLTNGFFNRMYKGFLQDRPISVKKYGNLPHIFTAQVALNDIVFASQTSGHRNILKLLGCCLETQFPILVFESLEYGSLADRLYGPKKADYEPLLWRCRLKIAMDMANAVSYLHTAFPRPIIYRNIKPQNILLNEHHIAKLSNLSFSVTIPEGESHVHTYPTGTVDLFSSEYMETTSLVNEKLDVFNFGWFLIVLLTGQSIFDIVRVDKKLTDHIEKIMEKNNEIRNPMIMGEGPWPKLTDKLEKFIENNRFNEIVDPIIMEEGAWPGKEQQLRDFNELALECMCEAEEDRPTMIDVTKRLRQFYKSQNLSS